MLIYRQHVRFAGAIQAPPTPHDVGAHAGLAASPSPPLLVSLSPNMADVAMSLGDGKNTNASELGDSKHASPGIPESSLPSSFAPLPLTTSVTVDMMDAHDDIKQECSSPLSDSSSSSVEDISTRHFHFERAVTYNTLGAVAHDIQALGDRHNELLNAVSKMASHVISLERLCQCLLKKPVNELEDADDVLAYGESTLAPSP